jgi:hypothetical protein
MDEHAKHLHGMMDDLLPPHGSAADADALDALLGGDLQDAELWNAPALFGTLAPGLQCSEACHRPGQRCLDPTHSAHCTKCVRGPLPGPPARFCAFLGLARVLSPVRAPPRAPTPSAPRPQLSAARHAAAGPAPSDTPAARWHGHLAPPLAPSRVANNLLIPRAFPCAPQVLRVALRGRRGRV